MVARYSESVFCESKPRIEDGVIHGVKILGESSVNQRRYSKAVREAARDKYEGARVNIDHPKKGESVDRSFRDWVGVIENVQVRRDGTFGDLRLRQEHSEYKAIVEAAEKFWRDFGLSHVADCESRRVGGVDEVTEIVEVFSVDIVTEPATTKGLTESRNRDMAKPNEKKTVKQVAESLPADHGVRKLLMEMDSGGYDLGSLAVEEPVTPSDPSINAELVAALTKTNEMLLMVLAKGKAQAPPAAGNNPPPNQENPPVANDPNKPAEDPEKEKMAAMEAKLARFEVKELFTESGREPKKEWVDAAVRMEENARKTFVESLPKHEANTRESRGSRPAASPPANTSGGGSDADEGLKIFEARQKRNKELREARTARVR